jgi:acetyltransferase-like isoleucine patch superfamily enzyme
MERNKEMIFKSIGKNCKISDKASIFNGDMIEIGDNVRIDDFVILSGGAGLKIGDHIHIAAGGYFYAGAGIVLEDFVELGPRLTIISQSDDFLGDSLVGPCIPNKYKPGLKSGLVTLKRHVVTGVGVTIFPGVTLGEGASIGSHTLVRKDCEPWSVYVGSPARKIGERSRKMMDLEKEFLEEYNYKNRYEKAFSNWRDIHDEPA